MWVRHQNHGGVPVSIAIVLCSLDQLFNLSLGQVFAILGSQSYDHATGESPRPNAPQRTEAGCFVSVSFRNENYCMPVTVVENTKRILACFKSSCINNLLLITALNRNSFDVGYRTALGSGALFDLLPAPYQEGLLNSIHEL